MRITIKDVAREAGVSIATASMALNNRAGVNAQTRSRVLRVAREMHYVANHSAQALVMQESGCIGLMLPEIQNPFYSAIVDILSHLAEERGYTLLLGITNNSAEQEEKYTRFFLSRRVQGVIVVPILNPRRTGGCLEMLRQAGVPIVFCTERYAGSAEPVVMCDFALGQYEMTKYLIDRGLRDLWFVSVDIEAQFTALRYQGYVRALEEAGLPVRRERELLLKMPWYDQAYEGASCILEDPPEAVVCINDIMTMAIMKRILESGLSIPRDISVAGFDDIMFSALVSPPLTTVHQPLQEICEQTMQLLMDAMEGAAEGEGVHLIAPHLVVRETTA